MNQPLNTFLQFYKSPIVSNAIYLSLMLAAHCIFFFDVVPWVRLCLFKTERNTQFFFIDFQDHNLDFIPYV